MPDNLEQQMRNVDKRLRFIHDHMRRVLRKFPRGTVPNDLTWALGWAPRIFARPSRDEPFLRLLVVPDVFGAGGQIVTIPITLLDAPEQDIHAWTRRTYWEGRRMAEREAEHRALRELAELERAARAATQKYERALSRSQSRSR